MCPWEGRRMTDDGFPAVLVLGNPLSCKCLRAINTSHGCMHACILSCVQLFVTPWTAAHQAPLSMGFSCKNTDMGFHFLLQVSF